MTEPDDEGAEFGWVARYRDEPATAPPMVEQVPDDGLTFGHRRALVVTGAAVLLAAAVLSAAAGLRIGGRLSGESAASLSTSSTLGSLGRDQIASTALPAATSPTTTTTTTTTTLLTRPSSTTVAGQPASVPSTTGTNRRSSASVTTRRTTTGNTGASQRTTSTRRTTSTLKTASTMGSSRVPTEATTATRPSAAGKSTTPTTAVQTTKTTAPTTTAPAVATVVPTTSTAIPIPAPPAGVANGGIAVEATGEVTFTDVIRSADGTPASGVLVDLFKSDADGRRAGFLSSTETDASGRYRLTAPSGSIRSASPASPVPASDCLVAVFVAPAEAYLAETGSFREALVCPTEPGAILPQVQVQVLPTAEAAANASAPARSVLASGGKLYLRGIAADDAEAARLARRYQWSIGSARVVLGYCCPDPDAASQSASIAKSPAGLERVSIDSGLASAFEPGSSELNPEALFVTRQMATVLKWNPTARLRIVIAIDPAVDEQPTADLLAARRDAVVKGLGNQVAADRVESITLNSMTEGRRLGGRSIDSQLEFVLLWP